MLVTSDVNYAAFWFLNHFCQQTAHFESHIYIEDFTLSPGFCYLELFFVFSWLHSASKWFIRKSLWWYKGQIMKLWPFWHVAIQNSFVSYVRQYYLNCFLSEKLAIIGVCWFKVVWRILYESMNDSSEYCFTFCCCLSSIQDIGLPCLLFRYLEWYIIHE